MTDTTLDLTLERIAFRSTRGEGQFAKRRWTELAIYFCHNAPAGTPPFVSEIIGRTIVPGETDRARTHNARTLTLAIDHLRDAQGNLAVPAKLVQQQALAWWEDKSPWLACKHMPPELTGVNADPAPVRTYTDEQRAAAVAALTDARHGDRLSYPATVDAIAAALGLTREVARG